MLIYLLAVALLQYCHAITLPGAIEADSIEERQALLNGLLGSRNPFISLVSRLPVVRNPETTSSSAIYDNCEASNGESGICLPAVACSLQGGRVSGSCRIGAVCCINVYSKCSGSITLNNTYWQSPSADGISESSGSTTCAVSVRVDQSLVEQKRFPICQIRLDILQFTTAQPTAGVCTTDSFTVSGGNNIPPVICGDNDEQHMYIHVPPSSETRTDVLMTFSFGANADTTRSWKIKVSMIPCGASYSAPPGCLQYYSGISGVVRSFNWKETTTSTRELVNQAHSICFNNEVINSQRANEICFETCKVLQPNSAFFVSGDDPTSFKAEGDCRKDYVGFSGYYFVFGIIPVDRACGGLSFQIPFCSLVRPFSLYVKTDGSEAGEGNNNGFCLTYHQRLSNTISYASFYSRSI